MPEITIKDEKARIGALFFGSTTASAHEAVDRLEKNGMVINTMRIRAFPFQKEVFEFISNHDIVFAIEQNRDSQMQILLAGECQVAPGKLVAVTNFNGLPITATMITNQIHTALLSCGREFLQASTDSQEELK